MKFFDGNDFALPTTYRSLVIRKFPKKKRLQLPLAPVLCPSVGVCSQVDVVDAQFSQLMDQVRFHTQSLWRCHDHSNSRSSISALVSSSQLRESKSNANNDFTLVVRAHENFLRALVRQSFMQVCSSVAK